MESALVIGQIRTLVQEVFLDFSSFREAANTSREAASFSFSLLRDSWSSLHGSLAAFSCGEKSCKTSGNKFDMLNVEFRVVYYVSLSDVIKRMISNLPRF